MKAVAGTLKNLPFGIRVWATAGLTILIIGLGLTNSAHALPLTCTWTGATDNNFATATNWTGCNSAAPTNGDNLAFSDTVLGSASAGNLVNNISNLQVGNISISGFSASGYTYDITGNGITLSGGLTDTSSGGGILDLAVTLSANQTFSSNDLFAIGDSSLPLTIGAYTLTFAGNGGQDVLNSPIVGTGVINLNGTNDTWGFLHSASPNFSGQLNIITGRLMIDGTSPSALGTASVNISSGATLHDGVGAGTYTFPNPITMVGTGDSAAGAVAVQGSGPGTATVNFTGPVALGGNTQIALDTSNANFSDIVGGCNFTFSTVTGSTGTLSKNFGGVCAPVVVSPAVSSTPDTGYGTPGTSHSLMMILTITSIVSVGAGLLLIFHRKITKSV